MAILGSAGGGDDVGSYKLFNFGGDGLPDTYTDSQGNLWQKTGVIDLDTPHTLPSALYSASAVSSGASGYTNGTGCDGTYVYFYNGSTGYGHRYNISTQTVSQVGSYISYFTYDGGLCYHAGNNSIYTENSWDVGKYNTSFGFITNYTGISHENNRGIASDGTYIYLCTARGTTSTITQYSDTLVATGTTITITGVLDMFTYYDGVFYVLIDGNNYNLHMYDVSGNYLGIKIAGNSLSDAKSSGGMAFDPNTGELFTAYSNITNFKNGTGTPTLSTVGNAAYYIRVD